jgi:hypothetical protein
MTTVQSLENAKQIVANLMRIQRGEKQAQLALVRKSLLEAIEAIQAKTIIVYTRGDGK